MERIPLWLKIILWIYCFPIMLVIFIASKFSGNSPSDGGDTGIKDLIERKCCPNCGSALQASPQANGRYYYSCPRYCLNFVVQAEKPYYKSNYFDERESDKRFKATTCYVERYDVKVRHWDSDIGGGTGAVEPGKARLIQAAFEELRVRTLSDTPIIEDAFAWEIEAGRKLIQNQCPICERYITKKVNFVKGYGENVTKLVKTGYGEYAFKTDYVGTRDQNIVTYVCGCQGVNYRLTEYEENGMYYKKYSTTADNDRLQRACAFSEIYTAKRTWLKQSD